MKHSLNCIELMKAAATKKNRPWYQIADPGQIDSPALVIYPARVRMNLDYLISQIDDIGRLRPHIKTHKCPEAAVMAIEAGITKFKCATIAEAELLGIVGAPDVLLACQPEGPKLLRFLKLMHAYPGTRYSCLVDNPVSSAEISRLALQTGLTVPVYLDLNVGMNRTGIFLDQVEGSDTGTVTAHHPGTDDSGQRAAALYRYCHALKGLKTLGLHCYDGHIQDHDPDIRTSRVAACFSAVKSLQAELVTEGFERPVIIAGGTPTFPVHARNSDYECSPGTFIYWDAGYQTAFPEQHYLPAALVLARIISFPGKTTICLDLGHKSVGSENILDKRIRFLNAPELIPLSQSEEHLVMEAGAGHGFQIGDVLYGLPWHICPTVALYERAVIVEEGLASGEWLNIARDRKLTV